MSAYDIQEAETLADLYPSITAIQPLLVKQVLELDDQELEQGDLLKGDKNWHLVSSRFGLLFAVLTGVWLELKKQPN